MDSFAYELVWFTGLFTVLLMLFVGVLHSARFFVSQFCEVWWGTQSAMDTIKSKYEIERSVR